MSSWGDGVSEEVQADLDALFAAGLEAAENFLSQNGEFFPFGVDIDHGDELAMFTADPGLGEYPPSQAVLDALYEAALENRSTMRAVGFVSDVRAEGGDAVFVDLEHSSGMTLAIAVPYRLRRLRRGVTISDEMEVSRGTQRTWST